MNVKYDLSKYGLNTKQITDRIDKNQINSDVQHITKSYKDIVSSNIFTLFNLINACLAGLVIFVGSFQNLLFMGVIVCNTLIGIYQEIKAKRLLDKLSLLTKNKVQVIRNNEIVYINQDELVVDDVMIIKSGAQVPCDSLLLEGNLEVNESMLNGESDVISKSINETIFSGCFIVAGEALIKIVHVSHENYVNKLLADVKKLKKYPSQLRDALDNILKIIGLIIVPVGIILFLKQYFLIDLSLNNSIITTVAAMIGMIPEGLILLTSVALAVSCINLGKHNTLVQELYCIETLARVDVLCLDKTGTITKGSMSMETYISLDKDIKDELIILANCLEDENATFKALKNFFNKDINKCNCNITKTVPFSSIRKFSGLCIDNNKSIYMGAYEFLVKNPKKEEQELVEKYASMGRRVITVATSNDIICESKPDNVTVIGFILLIDPIREEAKATLDFFKQQGVEVKIISGDHPSTVNEIAKQAELETNDNILDVSQISDEELKKLCISTNVFGRVNPHQKKIIIEELKNSNKTVAMVGDGVNDVLALKSSNCSISVASGSEAAKNIANLILLDDNFANIPHIVNEGRRVINNIERSASLFLVKTTFSTLIAIVTIFTAFTYPFLPIQLTIISTITIGIPGFLLSLEPNNNIVKGNFIYNVFAKALPGAFTVLLCVFYAQILGSYLNYSPVVISTMCVLLTGLNGILVLRKVCLPFTKNRFVVFITMSILFVVVFIVACLVLPQQFAMTSLNVDQYGYTAIGCALIPFALHYLEKIFTTLNKRYAK